ncbi:9525_t:CDS:10, partial [Paraglomus occultum]
LVYDMCNASPKPHTERLFNAIAKFLEDCTSRICMSILKHNDIVTAYTTEWEHYRLASYYSSLMCDYLNGHIIKVKDGGIPGAERRQIVGDGRYRRQTIQALAHYIWKERVVYTIKTAHGNRLMHQIFELICRDRDGEDSVPDGVQKAIASLVQLNSLTDRPLYLYVEEFENPYLKQTRKYYEREAAAFISSKSISEYMKQAHLRLEQEAARNSKYCHHTSHETIIKECETQYVALYQSRIHAEFESMVANEKYEAYALLSRIPGGVSKLLETFEQYVANLGKKLIINMGNSIAKDSRDYVESLVSLHTKYSRICQKVFSNDSAFVAALDKAFRTVVNDSSMNPAALAPEVLARYCDYMLRKNQRAGLTENDAEERLSQAIILLEYVDDKDIFQKFYSRMLAKRLIYNTSSSEETEGNMISRLKVICGVEYTGKLQRMFTDVTVSTDINNNFNDFLGQSSLSLDVDFGILVLTAGAWPLTQVAAIEFQLPSELEKSVSYFTTFYNNHHSGRKLTWLWHLSKADVKLTYLDRRYEFSVSLHQLGVLLLFNNVDVLTLKDIKEHTRLNDAEVRRIIKPLVDLAVFIVEPGAITDDSELRLNMKFTNKRTKIKITSSLQSDSPQESDVTHKSVYEDRKFYIQAIIVRVMKSRRVLTHAQLVSEVIVQAKSRFSPDIQMIDNCLDQLLDKQYIGKSKENKDTFVYVA